MTAPWAASPSRARAVELVSGPAKVAGVPVQGLLVLSGVVQPPSVHCSAVSQETADVHRRRARHTGGGQCGQGQTLLIAPGVIVGGLGLGAEQAGVGTRRLLGGQEPGHQVGAAEGVGILTQGMGIQDEQGQLSGSIHSSRGGVGVDVVGQVAEGGVGVTRIRAGRGHGQNGVGRSREVGRARRRGGRDVATRRQLTGQPVRASLSRGRLGEGGGDRGRDGGGAGHRRCRGDGDQQADGECSRSQEALDGHGVILTSGQRPGSPRRLTGP